MTVETSVVLPLFLFAMVTMTMPFTMMGRQRQVQAVVELMCEDLCQPAYVGYEPKEKRTEIRLLEGGLDTEFDVDELEEMAMVAYAQAQVRWELDKSQIRKLSLSQSRFMEDGEMVSLVTSYGMALPLPVLDPSAVPMANASCRQA